MQLCWICGNKANSQEHKFKKSDLKRNYGKKYSNNLVHFLGKKSSPVRSYKSSKLLFPKVICISCNGVLTKTHDNAYDKFVQYVESNFEILYQNKSLDFGAIYGEDWYIEKSNLFRYIAKHAGCKIVTGNKKYDLSELSRFILGSSQCNELKIHFILNEGVYQLEKLFKNNIDNYVHLFNSETIYFTQDETHDCFGGWISYRWISIVWVVSKNIRKLNDLNIKKEILALEYLVNCDPFTNMDTQAAILNIEHNGSHTLEETVNYFATLIM